MSVKNIYVYFEDLSEDKQYEIQNIARENLMESYEELDEGDMDLEEWILEKIDEEIANLQINYI